MKKKILFVINTLGHAGAETAMLELIKCFDEETYELSLYVLMAQGELVHRLPPNIKLINDKYSDLSVLSKAGNTNMIKTLLKAAFKNANLLRLIPYMIYGLLAMLKKRQFQIEKLLWRMVSDGAEPNQEEYDLAIAYLEGGSAYYVADHIRAKQKAAFVHIDYSGAGYTRQLDQDCYLGYDRIFTVSDEVRSHFLLVYPECEAYTKVFHNMLDVDAIKEKAKEPGGFTDDFEGTRLLTVGRLTYQKAYDIAIDAMLLLKRKGYHLRWYVLGEGPERKLLERKIEKAGLTSDFILLGAVANPYPYYVQTDIYVHATRFEGKSIAIQEAQILGCVIIASACPGNKEQIEPGKDGIFCKLTAEGIADSIIDLIDQKELQGALAEGARGKIINSSKSIEQLLELMQTEPFITEDRWGEINAKGITNYNTSL